jgi:hypothetical protein
MRGQLERELPRRRRDDLVPAGRRSTRSGGWTSRSIIAAGDDVAEYLAPRAEGLLLVTITPAPLRYLGVPPASRLGRFG